MNVTLITRDATRDNLTEDDYRDIFAELRQGYTLRQFAELSRTGYSIAWWSQFEAGAKPLTHRAKQDLRHAVGLPPLPMLVSDAVETGVDPDAVVYRVGDDDQARRVLLVATQDAVSVHWNGTAPVVNVAQDATTPNVTGITSFRQRKAYWRPCLSPELGTALAEAGIDAETALWNAVEKSYYGRQN